MLIKLAWPAAFVLVSLLVVWRLDVVMRRFQENLRFKSEAAERELEVARLERKVQAELAERTMDATANLRNAQLAQEAAEAQAAAEVAAATVDDQIAAERKAIAAYAEGHAEAERLRGLSDQAGPSDVHDLRLAYEKFLQYGPNLTFGTWLGTTRVVNGRVQH